MKNSILLFSIFLISFALKAQETQPKINWMTFNEALAAQKETPKKIMMDVYTYWCGPCKMLDKNTFQNKDLVKYVNEHFYAVKFNGEGNEKITYQNSTFTNPKYDPKKSATRNSSHQFTDYLQVKGFPSIYFFDVDGALLAPLPGYRTAKQLEFFLKMFNTDKYKVINSEETFEKYKSSFVYEFGE